MNTYCETCLHAWHGLACMYEREERGSWGGIVKKKCLCPSQYVGDDDED